MVRDAAPHLASAASDPAVNVAVLRFRERAKYSSLEGGSSSSPQMGVGTVSSLDAVKNGQHLK